MKWDVSISTDAEAQRVEDKLIAFDATRVPLTQDKPFIHLNFNVKNEGAIIAGINAYVYGWKILYISRLFVEEKYRHQGLGSHLMQVVTEKAKVLGVDRAHVDTYEWQAKDFYLKHGYEIFATLKDFPRGHVRYYFKKEPL
ncbi:MAG: hypothetical protein A2Y14_02235 [Verrucomicrobia bacterium GWF2_51_19]|nr:MAG: hypothetical protein A2Y14_02235 [Verrucomicrobia bacterium GWF2_51_19]HCJ12214.1 GNAT family N-acetyltransferase [Opitutae bacterium]